MAKHSTLRAMLASLLLSVLSACSPSVTAPATATVTPTATRTPPLPPRTPESEPTDVLTPRATSTPGIQANLPAPLYFIGTDWQIWRLETDGHTVAQITSEPDKVLDFDISPVDGSLAYVSGNALILADPLGQERRVLMSGPVVSTDPNETWNETLIENVRWSPAGDQIAYGLDGVNVISPLGGEPRILQASDSLDVSLPSIAQFYRPTAWSPDGAQLLLSVRTYPTPGEGIAVLDIASGARVEIRDSRGNLPCCNPSWSLDGRAVYYGSDISFAFVAGETALWQANAATGASTMLALGVSSEEYARVAFPQELEEGHLYFFMTVIEELMPDQLPLTMYRATVTNSTASDPEPLRSDGYVVAEVLWSPDGGGAVIVDITQGYEDAYSFIEHPFIGPLVWLESKDRPAVVLPASGRRPRWGR